MLPAGTSAPRALAPREASAVSPPGDARRSCEHRHQLPPASAPTCHSFATTSTNVRPCTPGDVRGLAHPDGGIEAVAQPCRRRAWGSPTPSPRTRLRQRMPCARDSAHRRRPAARGAGPRRRRRAAAGGTARQQQQEPREHRRGAGVRLDRAREPTEHGELESDRHEEARAERVAERDRAVEYDEPGNQSDPAEHEPGPLEARIEREREGASRHRGERDGDANEAPREIRARSPARPSLREPPVSGRQARWRHLWWYDAVLWHSHELAALRPRIRSRGGTSGRPTGAGPPSVVW